ncbi:hypothetical protein GH714_007085 [Hevea brasiliensis]|uniref:Myb-like domain-containing protein n=1 Tax=Hevea brasiliensis TaxID=3981 RepID=A0A6A6KHY7_HEVBR|nr:hypothetical protein GH714_007085 [Hevea brasiliensis]
MVLEQQLNLATNTVHGDPTNVVDNRPPSIDGGDDGSKAPRLPRWTRQEILVLIQGKKVAENRVRRGRTAGMAFGSGQVEPKWASVSSYCKRHGVNRGPVQCRKRWSNLAGDYKKIKEWETQIREETESFWVMRNDLRRERKLPGFFDREFMIFWMELGVFRRPPGARAGFGSIDGACGRCGNGTTNEKHPASNPEVGSASHENRKRKRLTTDGDEETINVQNQLIDVLEKNGKMLTAQLKAQNTNFQLDREQRKDHADSLVAVLNKLADALGKIADKL